MGSPFYVSKHTGLLRRHSGPAGGLLAKLIMVNGKACPYSASTPPTPAELSVVRLIGSFIGNRHCEPREL